MGEWKWIGDSNSNDVVSSQSIYAKRSPRALALGILLDIDSNGRLDLAGVDLIRLNVFLLAVAD